MPHIELNAASVQFPIYNAKTRSLKNKFLQATTGGFINEEQDGRLVINGLNNITLSIHDGERVGLIGHNGSGKTTLLRVLSGIYIPNSGLATISGECVSLINISLGIDQEATGRDNIRLRAAMMGVSRHQLEQEYDNIAEFSGLGEFLDMPFRTYSSGMQMRLAFSVSTSIKPEILIMDEWLSTGDEDFKAKAEQRMSELVSNAHILILASHSRDLLLNNCERLIWLEHGSIRMDGPAEEVATAYFD
ncbi:ABC transporter ATP-binding protein [Ahrensia kielensis]|uniref:ABC transporter ATP-binding protein n=1 Tax=Ahrensia kielensis TaxID=76980 RepID=UPI0003790B8E|nr:ABC transporter ATP-binding protein [Ahrensia kielensis]